jgi:GcrA cell cycle regulator
VIDPVPMENATADDFLIPQAQRRSIHQLESHHCCWPIGDPAEADFFYCGGPRVKSRSYCLGHCHTAYRPPSRKPRPDRQELKKGRILADLV